MPGALFQSSFLQCLPMTWFHQWWSRSLNGNFWFDAEGGWETIILQSFVVLKSSLQFSHCAQGTAMDYRASFGCLPANCNWVECVEEVGSAFESFVPSLNHLTPDLFGKLETGNSPGAPAVSNQKDVSQLNRRSSAQRSLNQGVLSVCCSCHQLCGGPCMLQ